MSAFVIAPFRLSFDLAIPAAPEMSASTMLSAASLDLSIAAAGSIWLLVSLIDFIRPRPASQTWTPGRSDRPPGDARAPPRRCSETARPRTSRCRCQRSPRAIAWDTPRLPLGRRCSELVTATGNCVDSGSEGRHETGPEHDRGSRKGLGWHACSPSLARGAAAGSSSSRRA
jgi:hypothetical protein